MIRLSIGTLMAVVVVCAVGMAALRNANELWAGTMMLVAMTAVGVALLGAIILKGRERCWWLGFAVFSGSFLAIAFAPGLSTEVMPRLVTTRMIIDFHARLAAEERQAFEREEQKRATQFQNELDARQEKVDSITIKRFHSAMEKRRSAILQKASDYGPFLRVGHSLFALLAG